MFYCQKCGSTDCCERTDLIGEPVLCDDCYLKEVYGEINCDRCDNSYYLGDRMYCRLSECKPNYPL